MFEADYYEGNIFAMDIQLDQMELSSETATGFSDAEDIAYVIYTSGSTGYPKGCCISNRSLSNYIQWSNKYYFEKYGKANFGLYTSVSFDLTVTSIYCSLTTGGSLYIYNQHDELPDIFRHSFSQSGNINSIKLTPSHINYLKGLELSGTTIHSAIVGGEAVTEEHIEILKSINPSIQIYNEYGPTEATVGCVVKELERGEKVMIGKPVTGAYIYILDANGSLCGTGIPGEIYISGPCLSKGYFKKEELTAARFVDNPYKSGTKMYHTGDAGRWMANGEIEYLGRIDEQLKVRGYRIEPGEIESTLRIHPEIEAAIVTSITNKTGDKELIAYIVGKERLNSSEMREYLSRTLPAYMLPDHFMQLPELPLTPNGKIDRKKLPYPSKAGTLVKAEYVMPVNEIEISILEVYEEVLKKGTIGMTDDFFALGGDSIKSIQIVARLCPTTGASQKSEVASGLASP